ncbi:MAG: hypothetical protein Q4A15_05785 [Prevotellaceae bacterium]|nr:hypothetical protein [Prevotellaceae bacterium]
MKYELTIAHRVCPILAKTAFGYSDKFSMVNATTESLKKALLGVKTRLVVILDGCDKQYNNLFIECFKDEPNILLEIVETPAIGNSATYGKQLEILYAAQTDYVYFSEDDYVYMDSAFRRMIDFMSQSGVDFVTPLDHPDRYIPSLMRPVPASVRITQDTHWRSTGTTCLTFMTKSSILRNTAPILSSYVKKREEGSMWLGLTKENVFNFKLLIKAGLYHLFGIKQSFLDILPLCAWKRHHLRIILTRKHTLWSPIPTLAVHLCTASLPLHSEEIIANECGLDKTRPAEKAVLKYLGL